MYYTGIIQCLRSDYKEAEQNFSKSLKIFEALDDQKRIADMHNAFGRYYRFTSSYGESLKHLYKASKILEEVGNERSLSIVLNNIAATYERLTDFPKALEYGERAYQIALKMNV
jgi:tetratricopeptide (TPR) repeat protein